jgi:plastocyanin
MDMRCEGRFWRTTISDLLRIVGAAATSAVFLPFMGCGGQAGTVAVPEYVPEAREVTITTVPVLVHEQEHLFPFLHEAFAKGGVLEGREVYAFVPSTITVIEGDTLHLTVINPEDDDHTLVLPGLSMKLPARRTTRASYVARTAGIYAFTCNLPEHMPMMWGQLVVLAPGAVRHTPNPTAPH